MSLYSFTQTITTATATIISESISIKFTNKDSNNAEFIINSSTVFDISLPNIITITDGKSNIYINNFTYTLSSDSSKQINDLKFKLRISDKLHVPDISTFPVTFLVTFNYN